jgi:hypothetical protein
MKAQQFITIALTITASVTSAFAQPSEDQLARLLAGFGGLLAAVERTAEQSNEPQILISALQRQVGLNDQDYRQLAETILTRAKQSSQPVASTNTADSFLQRQSFLSETLRLVRARLSVSGVRSLELYLSSTYRSSLISTPAERK